MQDIFCMTDKEAADTIRALTKSLGHDIPGHWTDDQTIQFFNSLSNDKPRIWTDGEKADMKYAAQMME